MNYLLASPLEILFFRHWRKELLNMVEGNVLEIGVGRGNNLRYYHKDCEVTAIDIDKKALNTARKRFPRYRFLEMDAQNLKFENNTFDYVITPLSLCTIPDPIKALKEIYRVLKHNGELRMLEHVKSENTLVHNLQSRLNGINKYIFGCDLTRETEENARKAGFNIVNSENLGLYGMFRYIRAKK